MIPYISLGKRIAFLSFLLLSIFSSAQEKEWIWELEEGAVVPDFFEKEFANQVFTDRAQLDSSLESFVGALHNEGFLAASIDTTYETAESFQSIVYCGPQFDKVQLDLSAIDPEVLSAAGLGKSRADDYSLSEIRELIDRILAYQENNGHPFAFAFLEPTQVDTDKVAAKLRLDKNYPVKVDSIDLIGSLKLNDNFLQRYIRIREGDLYSERDISDISRRLNELPYLEEVRPPQINFRSNSAKIKMYLNKKNASRFNFVLGLLPDSETGKLEITGDGLIHVVNGFGIGEELRLEYRNFPNSLQEVQTQLVLPYLPYVPVGLEMGLNVLLRDTLHRNVISDLGVYYDLSRNGRVRFFWERNETRLLSVDKNELIASGKAPQRLDLTINYYGVGFEWARLDYKFNPRKGRNIIFNFAMGSRRIFENTSIRALVDDGEIDFNPYENLRLRNTQAKADWLLQQFLPIKKRSTFLSQYKGALTRNLFDRDDEPASSYYENEQFRIGGNRVLRGFDEESIFTDMFHLLTLEYRYLLSRNSYYFLFSDSAFLTDLTESISDIASFNYGFGTGFSFETKAGIFGISFALGGSRAQIGEELNKNPPRFRNGKIHFGYVSYF